MQLLALRKPKLPHLLEERFCNGQACALGKDGVDAAIRAQSGVVAFNLPNDLLGREDVKAIEAPANARLCEFLAVAIRQIVGID